MRRNDRTKGTTRENIQQFKATEPLLCAMLEELRKFASKKPEATLSKQKVFIVNRLLTDLKKLLTDEPSSKYLDLLTDDDLPQYSDVVLILSQYEATLRSFRGRYHGWDGTKQVWFLRGGEHMDADDEE
jgi:hypothetical protein